MRLTYLYHSGFVAETDECILIFDYYKDPAGVLPALLAGGKRVYVFVSHHHKDHLNQDVFGWERLAPTEYFISKDVYRFCRHRLRPEGLYKGVKPRPEAVHVLTPGMHYADGCVEVWAYASTDTGNSWVVRTGGCTLLHAGDLNAWIWLDESTKAEVAAALRDYERVLESIVADHGHVDVAMFPVDSRIGREWYTGAKMLVRSLDVGTFVPMHFEWGERAEDIEKRHRDAVAFTEYAHPHRGEYVALTEPGSAVTVGQVSGAEG